MPRDEFLELEVRQTALSLHGKTHPKMAPSRSVAGKRMGGNSGGDTQHSAVELIPGGVDSACHLSEVGKMSASLLVSCVRVATRPGLYPID